ncbi:MAG TPA: hypothetical protein VLM37_05555, partial [Fibrobacteraceae bacterium]|nr:hypothetical protein [Fibrobacteraceae bacterium]
KGDVSGAGLVGNAGFVSLIESYATGMATSGGLLASTTSYATASASFWDSVSTGTSSSKVGTAKSSSEMRTQSTFTDSGWDFTSMWAISSNANQGYPYLQELPLGAEAYTPAVRTLAVSGVAATSATLNGHMDWVGAIQTTAHGFCWNTTGSPTLADSVVDLGTTTDTGAISTVLSSLSPATTYYVRAYAVNDSGVDYGKVVSFLSLCDLDTNAAGEFLVENYADLKQVGISTSCPTDAAYRLTADIDASASAATAFASIKSFQGKFHGAGHVIQHLASASGLIASAESSRIDSLGLTDVVVSGSGNAGGLVASSSGDSIISVYTTGTVTTTASDAGGLVGSASDVTILGCYSTCSVSATVNAGGLVGNLRVGYIRSSYARGSVSALYDAGGLVGSGTTDTILESYSTGAVFASSYFGGLVGYIYLSTVGSCFWDTATSGLDTSFAGTGRSTLEMQTQSTFTDSGWDFTTTWAISASVNDGYPYLRAVNPQATEIIFAQPQWAQGFARLVPGGILVQGLRGDIGVYSLSGARVANVFVYRDGFHALELPHGAYVVRVED